MFYKKRFSVSSECALCTVYLPLGGLHRNSIAGITDRVSVNRGRTLLIDITTLIIKVTI